MKLTNTYQAIFAKLGGNTDTTIPNPKNKYEKLLNDIPVSGGMVVIMDNTTKQLDKTWMDIRKAMHKAVPVIVRTERDFDPVAIICTIEAAPLTGTYTVKDSMGRIFKAMGPNSYPVYQEEDA